jgi:hypothetical protein
VIEQVRTRWVLDVNGLKFDCGRNDKQNDALEYVLSREGRLHTVGKRVCEMEGGPACDAGPLVLNIDELSLAANGPRLSLRLCRRFLRSLDLEVFRGVLPAIVHEFILNTLPLVQSAQAGTFDRRDMDEHILASTLRLNEPIAFVGLNHFTFPVGIVVSGRPSHALVLA